MKNLLLEKVEYKIETTNFGVWQRFVYPNGAYFAEFKSHATFMGLPLFHYTRGKHWGSNLQKLKTIEVIHKKVNPEANRTILLIVYLQVRYYMKK